MFTLEYFTSVVCDTLFRHPDCGFLEKKLQQWDAGKQAKAWISVDIIIEYIPELTRLDFAHYKKNGLWKPPRESGIEVFCCASTKRIASVYIIDLSSKQEKAHVTHRVYRQFVSFYVDYFHRDQKEFMREMFKERGDWLRSGHAGTTMAQAIFDIEPAKRGAEGVLQRRMKSIKDFLPDPKLLDRKRAEPEDASVQPSLAEPPVTNEGPKRRYSGPNDLVEGLLAMPTDHEITRETQRMIKVAKEMMDHSDDGCIMMMFVEEILLAELQNEDVQTNIDEPSVQVLEKYLASVLRDAVASTRARGFPTLRISRRYFCR